MAYPECGQVAKPRRRELALGRALGLHLHRLMQTKTSTPPTKKQMWTMAVFALVLFGLSIIVLRTSFEKPGQLPLENPFVKPLPAGRFSLMTYNLENLFDTTHDQHRLDYAYLPLMAKNTPEIQAFCHRQDKGRQRECFEKDWRRPVLERKLRMVSQSILQIRGQGPEILALQEVENRKVLRELNRRYLQKARYQTEILLEGDDPRGIDVALLSRFPLTEPAFLHRQHGTRGILEVSLQVADRQILKVFVFHLPSQAVSFERRQQALYRLRDLVRRQPSGTSVVAMGDSNYGHHEDSFLREAFDGLGQLSHWLGCRHCEGSHFYRGTWAFLDWILTNNELIQGGPYRIVAGSITTPLWGPGQINRRGHPVRFQDECRTQCLGVSDHLPIYMEIESR